MELLTICDSNGGHWTAEMNLPVGSMSIRAKTQSVKIYFFRQTKRKLELRVYNNILEGNLVFFSKVEQGDKLFGVYIC